MPNDTGPEGSGTLPESHHETAPENAMTTPLRSRNWFGPKTLDGLMNRGYLKAEGFSDLVFDGRPVIGIANSASDLNPCNLPLRELAVAVRTGREQVAAA